MHLISFLSDVFIGVVFFCELRLSFFFFLLTGKHLEGGVFFPFIKVRRAIRR